MRSRQMGDALIAARKMRENAPASRICQRRKRAIKNFG